MHAELKGENLRYVVSIALLATVSSAFAPVSFAAGSRQDTILHNGLIYDGSGQGVPQ